MESPVRGFTRYVSSNPDIGGASVQAESRVLILDGSANRDERKYENSDLFDIRRPNAASHLAFGAGRHICLGAHKIEGTANV